MAAIGLGALAILLPVAAWLRRRNGLAFDDYVGWANILSFSTGALGLALVIVDRVGRTRDVSQEHLARIAAKISREILRHEGHQLARLVGTDDLESRAASVRFARAGAAQQAKGRRVGRARFDNLYEFYLQNTTGKLLILGAAGSGKTVLATRLVIELVSSRRDGALVTPTGANPVAVIFGLPTWNIEQDLAPWLSDQLQLRFGVGRKVAERLVNDGWILPVLDGLDEMDNEGEVPERATAALKHLNDYVSTTTRARIIVVSRGGGNYYDRVNIKLRDVVTVVVQPLVAIDIKAYLKEHCGIIAENASVFSELSAKSSWVYQLLSTPWRLSVAAAYQNSGGDLVGLLERGRDRSRRKIAGHVDSVEAELYETLIRTRCRLYRKRGYSHIRTRSYLASLAKFLAQGSGETSKVDLVPHECWERLDQNRIARHHALLCFFAAHIPFALAFGNFGAGGVPNPSIWTGVSFYANYGLLMALAIRLSYRGESPMKINGAPLVSRRGLLIAGFGVLAGTLMTVFAAAALNPTYGFLTGGTLVLMFVLVASIAPGTIASQGPMDPLRSDLVANTFIGLVFGLFLGTYMASLFNPEIGVLFGSAYILAAVVASTYARYCISTLSMSEKHGTPLRLNRFLKWGVGAGLLRTSGVAYQLRHREMHSYLANVPE